MGKPSDHSRTDRYKSYARQHRFGRSDTDNSKDSKGGTILPTFSKNEKLNTNETGGLDKKKDGRGSPSGSAPSRQRDGGVARSGSGGDYFGGAEASTQDNAEDTISQAAPPPAQPPDKSEDASPGNSAIDTAAKPGKPPITTRMRNGAKRFWHHMVNAITHSWINVLLVFVPIGIAADAAKLNPGIVFGMNAVAIVPLAGLLAHATESVASRMGDTLGALLNVSFGNAVELIIFIIALVKNEISIVQASLLGSILANLLLILGMAFLFGGLRYREQVYNSTVTQMSACLLSLSVVSLLLPTAFYQSFKRSTPDLAEQQVLKVSRGTSVVLLLVYILYLLFQLKSHAYMYESTPQEIIDEESHPGVLADIMNSSSSSSSDETSSTDGADSDTSGSGSIANAGKKIKRAIRNRRRRKSSASASSTTPSGKNSAISSPSMNVERSGSVVEPQGGSMQASRRGSTLGPIADGDEADAEDNSPNGPKIRDFMEENNPLKSKDRKKRRKKHHSHKKHHKKRAQREEEKADPNAMEMQVLNEGTVLSPTKEEPREVGFAEDVEVVEHNPAPGMTPAKSSFNMRQFSNLPRPALPKMLSNNVFVTPAPAPTQRPSGPPRSQSSGSALRRTSSLPDRLNQQISNTPSRNATSPFVAGSDPLPPFQHRRQELRKVLSEDTGEADGDKAEQQPPMSRTAATVLLLCSTGLVAICAEFMVNAIPAMIAGNSGVSQAFIGLIILPIVGNAAEHVTAVTVAAKNKMDLAIGVAVGSSIQIALFVTPVIVLLGWIIDSDMSLYFNIFDTISLFVTAFVVNFLVLDGRSNYLEGSLLIAAYVIIALGAFFYPSKANESPVGSVGGSG